MAGLQVYRTGTGRLDKIGGTFAGELYIVIYISVHRTPIKSVLAFPRLPRQDGGRTASAGPSCLESMYVNASIFFYICFIFFLFLLF